ncbi:DNA cytosine methyltransferase [Sphingorhabdus arenilitoris]|uniref:Cytosine-specific methyltransferase n=1 Tax=Sphingorhabdus arenilitoris TaxID=1490041 RepID=A0ABV8RIM3_9SPHN
MAGAATATSRYSRIREDLDMSIFNSNWREVDTDKVSMNGTPLFGDIFSGAGGLSVGFRSAGFRKAFSAEINKHASETLRHNFPESYHFEGDVADLSETKIKSVLEGRKLDVLVGGPPCQGFSVAGKRQIDDPRNELFLEFCRLVEICQPEFFVMENVPGILTMQKGAVTNAILQKFEDIGYPETSVRILEAAEYGVPQLRTRAIFVGNRLNVKNPYPKPTHSRDNYISINDAMDDLKNLPRDPATNHEWTNHSAAYEARISKVPAGGSLYETFRDAFKRQYSGVPSMAAKENHGGTHIHYEKNRVLSARELARLQTFPDDFFFKGGMKKAYWQIGNAVPCLLAEKIGLAIRAGLTSSN